MHICDFVDQFTLCCSGWLLAVFFSSNQSGSCRKNAFLSSSKSKIANESRHSFLSELLIYLSRSTSNHQSNQGNIAKQRNTNRCAMAKRVDQCHQNWCPCFFCFRPQSFFHCASASVTGGSNLTTAPPLRRPPVLIARARQTLTYGELGRAPLPRDGLFSAGEHRGGFSPSFDMY